MIIADILIDIANRLSSKLKSINASLVEKGQDEAASFDEVPAKINSITANPKLQSKSAKASTAQDTVVKCDPGYDGLSDVTIDKIETVELATPTISVSDSGKITVSVQQTGGVIAPVAGVVAEKQLGLASGGPVTPSRTKQYVAYSGNYITDDIYIPGESNFTSDNIRSGVTMWGTTGTYNGDGSGNGKFKFKELQRSTGATMEGQVFAFNISDFDADLDYVKFIYGNVISGVDGRIASFRGTRDYYGDMGWGYSVHNGVSCTGNGKFTLYNVDKMIIVETLQSNVSGDYHYFPDDKTFALYVVYGH